MKAIRFYGKNNIKLEEIPIPTIEKDEVLVKVKKVAISQIVANEYFFGPYITKKSLPIILGHSFGGIVVKQGEEVANNLVGKLVSVLPLISCGKCHYCELGYDNLCENLKYYGLIKQDGGLSEYVKVKKENIFLLDECNKDKLTFIEPMLIGLNIFNDTIDKIRYKFPYKKNINVLILGAGSLGFMTALVWSILRKEDNIFLNDIFLSRLQKLKELVEKSPTKYNINFIEKKYINREFFDIVIDASGFEPLAPEPALQEGFRYLIRGGCLVSVGFYYNKLTFNQEDMLLNSKSILSTVFYKKSLIKELPKILNKLDLDFSKIISTIEMKDVLSKGFYKVHIDKEEFIRLEVQC